MRKTGEELLTLSFEGESGKEVYLFSLDRRKLSESRWRAIVKDFLVSAAYIREISLIDGRTTYVRLH